MTKLQHQKIPLFCQGSWCQGGSRIPFALVLHPTVCQHMADIPCPMSNLSDTFTLSHFHSDFIQSSLNISPLNLYRWEYHFFC